MAEIPNVPDRTTARGLAERFGMTRDAVEGIIGDTHREYSSSITNDEPLSMTNDESIVGDGRMTNGDQGTPAETLGTVPITPVVVRNPNGGFLASILVLLFLGVGIALTFHRGCFEQRSKVHPQATADERPSTKQLDTIQNLLTQEEQAASTPPVSPTQVERGREPGQVPPEA